MGFLRQKQDDSGCGGGRTDQEQFRRALGSQRLGGQKFESDKEIKRICPAVAQLATVDFFEVDLLKFVAIYDISFNFREDYEYM